MSIDGRPVSPQDYRIAVSNGQVAGGRDGCNDWRFENAAPDGHGERLIVTTLVKCAEDDPVRTAFHSPTFAPTSIDLRVDGSLRLTGSGCGDLACVRIDDLVGGLVLLRPDGGPPTAGGWLEAIAFTVHSVQGVDKAGHWSAGVLLSVAE